MAEKEWLAALERARRKVAFLEGKVAASAAPPQQQVSTKLLRQTDAAAFVGLSGRTLERLRSIGEGPPYVRIGKRSLRYPADTLEAWALARSFT
jgi:predicted DNA-binding transcriptional regulator AlpA